MEDRADCDRSFGDALREVRARQEVCEHEWGELREEELAYHLREGNAIRDDVRVVEVWQCRWCLVFRYVALLLARRR